jgi:hypothetical protein
MATLTDECVSLSLAFQPMLVKAYYQRVTDSGNPRIVLFCWRQAAILKPTAFLSTGSPQPPPSGSPHQSPVRRVGSMSVTRRVALSALGVVLAMCTASATELSRYREFALGSSVETVTAVTQTAVRDLKTIHSRPALLQEVAWQPRYMSGAPVADRGSINEIVFSFVDDQLFRMTVVYDRSRTSGLTNTDMIAALTDMYGAATSPTKASADAVLGMTVLAEWQQADAGVVLRRSQYNEAFSLVITSWPLEAIARKAQTTALMLDAREAPAREAELARKRADEQRQAEELARTANKKVFKP